MEWRSAEDVPADVPIEIAGDEQVQPSIVIVIEESGGGRPATGADARLRRHIGERSIAVVAVEGVPPIARDVEIRESVVVVIADGHAHAVVVPGAGETRRGCHIRETAVAVLPIQPVPIRRIPTGEVGGEFCGIVQLPAVNQEDVEKAVVVVVEQGHAAAHGFDQVFLRRRGIAMREIDPGGVG